MKIKKVLMSTVIAAVVSSSILSSMSVSAYSQNNTFDNQIEDIGCISNQVFANDYDINSINGLESIDISEIPSDVTPIVFETEEDFFEFYNDVLLQDICIYESGQYDISNAIMPLSYTGNYSSSYTTQKDLIKIGASITSIKLKTNFTYQKENTVGPLPANKPRYKFKTVSPTCMLTGLTMGVDISQVSTTYSLSNYNSVCTSIGTGTIDYYIIVENIGKLYSKDFTIKHTFNLGNIL